MKKPEASLKQYKSLFPYFKRYSRHYIFGLVCLLAVDAAQIAIPQFIKRAVDLISSGVFELSRIFFLCLWMTILMAFISAGRFLWRYFIHGASRRIETEIREGLFRHLLTLSQDFYQKNKIGDLMARSTNDLNSVRFAIGMGLVALVDFIFMATAILIIIFMQDPRSALISVIPLPLITVLILTFGRTIIKKFRISQEAYSKMSDTTQETFAGLRVIKSFVKEWWFVKKFSANNDDYRKANMELVRFYGFYFPFVTFLSELTILLMLAVGGMRVVYGLMSPGSLVAMFRYLTMLIWPLMGAGFMVNLIQRGAVSLGRVNEILNTVPTIRDKDFTTENTESGTELHGFAIEIKDLNFSYNGNENVLTHINLTVKRGEWLGIMGRTGSGKSTLIKILTRMSDPPKGTVFVFDTDVHDLRLAELRGLFAVSPQDSYLFSDSLQNNIAYGLSSPGGEVSTDNNAPHSTMQNEAMRNEAIQNAAQMAALDRDISAFAEGQETLIGERGLTLSGGQKQRVAIARSLAADSEFLILDDSLSAVDAETEWKILDSLLAVRKGRTTIIISHRVSTLCHTDKVLVLDGGRQSEYGSPAELARAGGFYSRMAALQRLDEVSHDTSYHVRLNIGDGANTVGDSAASGKGYHG